MSYRTLPLLFLNLNGEMMYIIAQRLTAQQISQERATKVLNDIAKMMFNRKLMREILGRPLQLFEGGNGLLKALFNRLANASIMRLNDSSMEKLYDLMTMAVKHQILMCRNPMDIISVTLNHLDTIRYYYVTDPETINNIIYTHEYLIQCYAPFSVGQMQEIRYGMLNFFQDHRVKVSAFLSEGTQKLDGTFLFEPDYLLPRGWKKPGQVVYFDRSGNQLEKIDFFPGMDYEINNTEFHTDLSDTVGQRSTRLGLNMYFNDENQYPPDGQGSSPSSFPQEHRNALATKELNLLAKLLGSGVDTSDSSNGDSFKFKILAKDSSINESKDKELRESDKKVEIKHDPLLSHQSRSSEIKDIIRQMTIEARADQEEEEDLLSLMDKVN